FYEESLALGREVGDKQGIAFSLNNLGDVVQRQRDHLTAQSLYEESLAIFRELGDKRGIGYALSNLGEVAHRQADYLTARSLHEESLTIRRELGDTATIAESLEQLAALSLALKQNDRAVHLWGAAQAFRKLAAVSQPSSAPDDDRLVNAARA